MAELSVRETARRLNVNQARVRALLKAGRLAGRRIGSQWVVQADAVSHRLDLAVSDRGRPLSTRSAWCAAALLDGHHTPWLATSERSRLRARLSQHPATDVRTYRWWLQGRASIVRYRIAEADIAELAAAQAVVTAGISAASHYDLGLAFGNEAEVYVNSSVAAELVDEFFLVRSEQGNLIMHVEDSGLDWHQRTARLMDGVSVVPRLVVAVDLLDSDDTRSRSAGARLLEQALTLPSSGGTRVA